MNRCPHCLALLLPPLPPAPVAPDEPGRWWQARRGPASPPPVPVPVVNHCPQCGEDLRGSQPPVTTVVLVLAGARTTGKSVFVAVMMRQLEQYAAERGADLRPASPAVAKEFEEHYVGPLYEERGVMKSTASEATDQGHQRETLVFELVTASGRQVRLVVRDTAGEDLENPYEAVDGTFDFFPKADCALFLFDPLKVQAIADTLADAIPQHRLGGSANAVLDTTLRLMAGSPAHLGVVMAKFDVIQALRSVEGAGEWARILGNPGSTLSRDRGPNQLDADLVHEEVRSLMFKLEATTFLNTVERTMSPRPGTLRYFAVSALGESPNGTVLHTRGIAPFRCLDPVCWALAQAGVVL